MNNGVLRWQRSVLCLGSALVLITCTATRAPASIAVNLTSPVNGSTVSGPTPIACAVGPGVVWVDFYIDGVFLASSPPYIIDWNSSSVKNGSHTISVTAFGRNKTVLGSSALTVNVDNGPEITLVTPQNGTAVSGVVNVAIATQTNVSWSDFYVDGIFKAATPPSTWQWDTTQYPNGSHVVSASAFSPSHVLLGSASATVTVANAATSSSVTPGATIPGLTGSAASIPGADTNPAHYGQYDATGGAVNGYALIGGPLLDDSEAASFVVPTQQSQIETGINGAANQAANNYFNYIASHDPTNYLYQLQSSDGFYAAYTWTRWKSIIDRVDGACPMASPTTAEVLQWAANKWGINPLLLYATATIESHWDQTALGDNGGSSGVLQVADRNTRPYHAFPGFSGAGSMLARENTCFNADFYAAWIYLVFHGLGKTSWGDGNILAAVGSWDDNSPLYVSAWTYALSNQTWKTRAFGGAFVPY